MPKNLVPLLGVGANLTHERGIRSSLQAVGAVPLSVDRSYA